MGSRPVEASLGDSQEDRRRPPLGRQPPATPADHPAPGSPAPGLARYFVGAGVGGAAALLAIIHAPAFLTIVFT